MGESIDAHYAQLFLDDHVIEQTVRLQRVLHQPHKYYGNPVYTAGAPWEGRGILYLGGAYIDPNDGLWKAWYVTAGPPAYPEINYAVCMITSEDGFHWQRPELDVYRGHNGEKTNIVLDMGREGNVSAPTILYEPENAPEPWTMILSIWAQGAGVHKAYILHSPDGVHWEWEREVPNGIPHGMHDRCTALKGPDPDYPYVLLSRGLEDMQKWGLVRSAHRVAINSERAQGEPTRVVCPDLEDDPAGQIYHAYAFPYEGMYVGLIHWYWETNDPYGDMELMASRDSVNWQRTRPRKAFLPCTPGGGAVGAFDFQVTDTALSPPVRTRQGRLETLWFYYWGGPSMHGNRYLTFGRAMGLAQLRADGFCSLRANRFAGTLVTKPFVWPGGQLQVNVRELGGGGNGNVRTEVLTEDLKPVAGLALDDANVTFGDGIRFQTTWNGDEWAIAKMKGNTVRLKFYMENIDLFSFRASEERGTAL